MADGPRPRRRPLHRRSARSGPAGHPRLPSALPAPARGRGVHRSQFVTGTGTGGLPARPGGDHRHGESRIFGGAYDAAPAETRPVHGAPDLRHRPFGAAPRFGSAHLRLTAASVERASFCHPDSFLEPGDFGVAPRMRLIALAGADEKIRSTTTSRPRCTGRS
ncbi:hypothetical protein GCM10010275_35630 [Streptomyces litmocidini]|nr:DUF3626 domain-containing protein [Streptomyces litmocidini]GGU94807.1 hypothetical protein GCM10010275_35630 [Streptomyces litmocidini]